MWTGQPSNPVGSTVARRLGNGQRQETDYPDGTRFRYLLRRFFSGRPLDCYRESRWTARIWDAVTGQEKQRFEPHNGPVNSVAFSPDGLRVLTGSQDHTARVWEASTGHLLLQLNSHRDSVTSVAFSLDGKRIVTGSLDDTVRVWEAGTGKEVCLLFASPLLFRIQCVAFSPDGKWVVGGGYGGLAVVWNVATQIELCRLTADNTPVSSVAYSPDGQRIVTGTYGGNARCGTQPPAENYSP